MMRGLLYLIISGSFIFGCQSDSNKILSNSENILFIGNSYTYRNKGVDQHLFDLISSSKVPTVNKFITRAAKGKFHLYSHWKDTDTQEKIKSKNWNKVVLQEYSAGPIKEPNNFLIYGKKWANKIRKKNPKAEIFLYATWGYKLRNEMTDSLYNQYEKLGKKINAKVVPVGLMWKSISKKIDLYDGDGAHPNRKGTFINACLFYEYLENKDVRKTKHTDSRLPVATQKYLKELAHNFKLRFEKETRT